MVNSSDELDIEKFKNWREEYKNAEFITDNGKFIVGREVEKMSKSKYNVVNPDDICNEYGADTLRLYEMFLGPLEQAKPWNTAGITGVFGFLKKLWRLYFDETGLIVTNNEPSKDSLKHCTKPLKKRQEDIEEFFFQYFGFPIYDLCQRIDSTKLSRKSDFRTVGGIDFALCTAYCRGIMESIRKFRVDFNSGVPNL